jgi:hypothetical protein
MTVGEQANDTGNRKVEQLELVEFVASHRAGGDRDWTKFCEITAVLMSSTAVLMPRCTNLSTYTGYERMSDIWQCGALQVTSDIE